MIRYSDISAGLRATEGQEENIRAELRAARGSVQQLRQQITGEIQSFGKHFDKALRTQQGETQKPQKLKREFHQSLAEILRSRGKLAEHSSLTEALSKKLGKVSARKERLGELQKLQGSARREALLDGQLAERMALRTAGAQGEKSLSPQGERSPSEVRQNQTELASAGTTAFKKSEELQSTKSPAAEFNPASGGCVHLGGREELLAVDRSGGSSEGDKSGGGTSQQQQQGTGNGRAQYEKWGNDERQGVRLSFDHERLGKLELTVEDVFGSGLSIGLNGQSVNEQLQKTLLQELRHAALHVSDFRINSAKAGRR